MYSQTDEPDTSAICVQRFDDSLSPAIHITYRISLRSSSLREPRYPLLRVVSFLLFTEGKSFFFHQIKKYGVGTPNFLLRIKKEMKMPFHFLEIKHFLCVFNQKKMLKVEKISFDFIAKKEYFLQKNQNLIL
jgi:hypothetical protein